MSWRDYFIGKIVPPDFQILLYYSFGWRTFIRQRDVISRLMIFDDACASGRRVSLRRRHSRFSAGTATIS